MADIEFKDYSVEVKEAINEKLIAALYEAAGELESQVKRNTPVDTGQLKGSWSYKVDKSKGEAVIGSPLENAIWNEFGTGQYALKGDGRKGGWYIPAEKLSPKAKSKMKRVEIKGKVYYWTRGKLPQRSLYYAFQQKRAAVIRIFEKHLKGLK